jgi:hypothetical protein
MKRFFVTGLLLSLSTAFGQNFVASPPTAIKGLFEDGASFTRPAAPAAKPVLSDATKRRWEISLVPLIAANALDAGSSWGHRETNPLLAGSDGEFGVRAAGIKFGMVGAAVAAEYFLMKRHPKLATLIINANRASAVLTTAFAIHNFAVVH